MAQNTYKGKFTPRNPHKYLGDPSNIVFRSLWELKLFKYCDTHDSIKKWASEEIVIPYRSPVDNKVHRYYPDVYVEQIDRDGKERKVLIEVKPHKQTLPPDMTKAKKKDGTIKKAYLNEVRTWGVNQAKWTYAKAWCEKNGVEFTIMDEYSLGIKKKK